MNSDHAVAMDMPPCDVLAMMMAGIGDLFHIDAESRPWRRFEEEPALIAMKQVVLPRRVLQIFRAAAQE